VTGRHRIPVISRPAWFRYYRMSGGLLRLELLLIGDALIGAGAGAVCIGTVDRP
jgi:hypothetical protein